MCQGEVWRRRKRSHSHTVCTDAAADCDHQGDWVVDGLQLCHSHPQEHGCILMHCGALRLRCTCAHQRHGRAELTTCSTCVRACQEPIKRKLPLSMTIASLKTLMARAFKCEPALQHLAYRSKVGPECCYVP